MDPLHFGRIVWAEVSDPNGIRKKRPAVIVTPTEQIAPDQPLVVVCITTRPDNPPPADYVFLPWQRPRHPVTQLNRRCAAVCSWLEVISAEDVEEIGGIVPPKQMAQIQQRLADQMPSASS